MDRQAPVNDAKAEKMRMFQLPLIKDGVVGIGDLWDDRTSRSVRHRLFSVEFKDAKNAALKAIPLKNTMQEFYGIKTHDDMLKTMSLDGKASLSFLCGKIKLEGKYNYEKKTQESETSETVLFKHMNDEYEIHMVPRAREEIINKDVLEMLQNGDIEATHVVGGMIIGSQVIASIEVKERRSGKTETTKAGGSGSLSGGVMKVLASLEVSASIDAAWVDQHVSNDTEIQITVNANPPTDQTVTSLTEFIEFIKNGIPKLTKNVELYSNLGKGINGVPIRFLLYPISQYVDMKMAIMYRELTDILQNNLISVIAKCKDLMQSRFVKQRILDCNNALKFLLESESRFSQKVEKWEKEFRGLAWDIYERSVAALAAFSRGDVEMKALEDIVKEFRNGELNRVGDRVREFVREGTEELQKAYIDSNNISLLTKVKFFFDKADLDLWMGKANPRILLEIPNSCPEIYVKQFIDNVDRLRSLNIEIGVAMPSMAKTVRLRLKCDEATRSCFENEKVGNALDAIDATLNPRPTSRNVFYRIIGSLCGFKIPIDASETKNLEKVLKSLLEESDEREISFADSLCDVTTELRLSRDKPLICLPLGAPDTDFEVVKQFRALRTHDQFVGMKWMFCYFEITNLHEAPLMLLFQHESLEAICLDKSEVEALMLLQTTTSFNFNDITSLSPTKHRNSIDTFRQRYLYSIEIMCRLNLERPSGRTMLDPIEESMEELLRVIRTTLFNSVIDLMAVIAVNVTRIFPSLEKELVEYGWNQANKTFEADQLDRKDFKGRELIDELEKWKKEDSVKANEVTEKALKEFEKIATSKNVENKVFNKAVEKIIVNERVPENVKQRLKSIANGSESIKAKCGEIRRALSVDRPTVEESYEIGMEHLEALIAALGMFVNKTLPENMAKQLIGTYFKRSKLLAGKSDLSADMDRFLKDFRPYDILYVLMKVKYNETSATAELSDNDASRQASQMENPENATLIPGDMRSKHMKVSSDDAFSKHPLDRFNVIGHEYTFQACGEIYNTALAENLDRSSFEEKLVQRFADHLLEGRAIELISGDTCAVPVALFRAVSRRVCQMRPGLRVCVVALFESKLGENTSTLLRKLISCKFSASIERHNAHSVYMRMLMLPESLRACYGYDSIIVLNTKGLGWSKKMENSDARSCNWLQTLYVMSISNMVIVDDELIWKHPKLFPRLMGAIFEAAQTDSRSGFMISGTFGETLTPAKDKYHKLFSSLPHSLTQGKESYKHDVAYYCEIKNGDLFLNTSHRNADEKNEDYEEDARDLLETLLSKIRKLDIGFDFEFWYHLIGAFTVCSQEQSSRANCLKEIFDFSSLIHFSKKIAKFKETCNRSFKNHISRATKKNEESEADKCFETVPSNCSIQCNSCKDLVRFRDDLYNKSRGNKLRNDVTESYKLYRQLTCKASKVQYELGLGEVLNRKKLLHRLQDIVTETLEVVQSNQPDGIFSADKIQEIENKFLQNAHRDLNGEDTSDSLERVGELYQDHEIEDQEIEEAENIYDRRSESEDSGKEVDFPMEVLEVLGEEFSQRDCKRCQLEDEGRAHCSLDCFLSRWHETCYQNKSPTSDIKTQFLRLDCDERSISFDEMPRLSASKLVSLMSESKTISEFLQMMGINWSLSPLESFCLENEIDRRMSKFLRRKRPDYLHKGIQLDMNMLTEFKEEIKLILRGFQRDLKTSIHKETGILLQIFTLKRFHDKICTLGTKWASRNDPSEILKQLEDNYRYVITSRLESGFSSKTEGELAATYLIEFVQGIAAKETHRLTIESILNLPWMASSESIRIQYYEELAVGITRGRKTGALQHFRDPKRSIEAWYREVVNRHGCKEFETEYETRFKFELKRCLDEIGKFTRIEEIDAYLSHYEEKSDNVFTHKLFVKEGGDNFESIIDALKFELNRALESPSSYTQNKSLSDIWEEEEIQTRLGCTEICLCCGAICWSHRNHDEDSGEFKKHYAYHQPQGLRQTLFFADSSSKLSAAPCSEACEPFATITTKSKLDTYSYSIRRIPYLEDWKIQRHPHSKCHDLMRLFLQELHKDIAKEKNVKPLNIEQLRRYGCYDIKLPSILGALRAMKQ